MTAQQRKRYNLIIWVLFAVCFFIYGGLGLLMYLFDDSPYGLVLTVLYFGLLAGWGFSSLVGGVWLGCRFLSSQSKVVIVLACIFFMFTLQIFLIVGIFVAIPFTVYNVVKLRRGEGDSGEASTVSIAEPVPPTPPAPLTRKHSIEIRVASLVLAAVLFGVAIFIFIGMVLTHRSDRFFPSMEEAFAHASEGDYRLGEIIFIDEHENNVTVFSVLDGRFLGNTYLTEIHDGKRWYRLYGNLGYFYWIGDDSAHFFLYHRLRETGLDGRINRRVRAQLGRNPLFGTYRHEAIRNLSINGVPVEHVFEFTNERGERRFIWYFSDMPAFAGSREDIIISFAK